MSRSRKSDANALHGTYLPEVLKNEDALKALCKRILKLYIVKRKPVWDSYTGQAKSVLKLLAAGLTFGKFGSAELDTWRIVDECDAIKKEIDSASKHEDPAAKYAAYTSLIMSLHKKAVDAKAEEIPKLSNPSLRTDTYYAILSLVQEIVRLTLPNYYSDDVAKTNIALDKAKADLDYRLIEGLDITEAKMNIRTNLERLVLLGDRNHFAEAFTMYAIFPEFTMLDSKNSTYISGAESNSYSQYVKTQMKQDPNIKGTRLSQKPNIHFPYQFQPNFALIYLMKVHNEGLRACTALALKDSSIAEDKTFRTLYVEKPETFSPSDSPADMNEILGVQSEDSEHSANASASEHSEEDLSHTDGTELNVVPAMSDLRESQLDIIDEASSVADEDEAEDEEDDSIELDKDEAKKPSHEITPPTSPTNKRGVNTPKLALVPGTTFASPVKDDAQDTISHDLTDEDTDVHVIAHEDAIEEEQAAQDNVASQSSRITRSNTGSGNKRNNRRNGPRRRNM